LGLRLVEVARAMQARDQIVTGIDRLRPSGLAHSAIMQLLAALTERLA
jgi:hypothetical protein